MEPHPRRLCATIDDLAAALRRAGAPEAGSARLLELVAIATLQSLALRETVRPASRAEARRPAG